MCVPDENDNEQGAQDELREEESDEESVIAESYRVVQPDAIVVHTSDQKTRRGIVFTPRDEEG